MAVKEKKIVSVKTIMVLKWVLRCVESEPASVKLSLRHSYCKLNLPI